MAWVEKDCSVIEFQPLCYVQGCQPPDQAAQSHIQPGLESSLPGLEVGRTLKCFVISKNLVHSKSCKYLRCPSCFHSLCQTTAALPAPSTLLCVLATGVWEVAFLFQAPVMMEEAEDCRRCVSLLSLSLNTLSISQRVKIKQHCLISGKSQMTVEGVKNTHTSTPHPTVSAVAS